MGVTVGRSNEIEASDNVISNNTFLFGGGICGGYSLQLWKALDTIIENNTFIGNGTLSWLGDSSYCKGFAVETDSLGSNYSYRAIIRNNILGYGKGSLINIDAYSGFLTEKNILFRAGYVFDPDEGSSGAFKKWGNLMALQNQAGSIIQRNNIIYNINYNRNLGYPVIYTINNTYYNGGLWDNLDRYSYLFNNVSYVRPPLVAAPNIGEYKYYGDSGSLSYSISDFNFIYNHYLYQNKPYEIIFNAGPGGWYKTSLADFKCYNRNVYQTTPCAVCSLNQGSTIDPNCTPLNDWHSIRDENGPGFVIGEFDESYPRPGLTDLFDDLANKRFPDFHPQAGSTVIDKGRFPDEYLDGYLQSLPAHGDTLSWKRYKEILDSFEDKAQPVIYDGARPDLGAVEYDAPPPLPEDVTAERSGNTIRITWSDYIDKYNKDAHYGYKFDLRFYLVAHQKNNGEWLWHTLDRHATEFVDDHIYPWRTYSYILGTY